MNCDRSRTRGLAAMDDEIDALRIERDSARTVVKEAYAEVRRLRNALDRIARAGEGVPDWRTMVEIARDALEDGSK